MNAEAFDIHRADNVTPGTNPQSENSPEKIRIVRETVQDTTIMLQENRHVSEEDYDELVDK